MLPIPSSLESIFKCFVYDTATMKEDRPAPVHLEVRGDVEDAELPPSAEQSVEIYKGDGKILLDLKAPDAPGIGTVKLAKDGHVGHWL